MTTMTYKNNQYDVEFVSSCMGASYYNIFSNGMRRSCQCSTAEYHNRSYVSPVPDANFPDDVKRAAIVMYRHYERQRVKQYAKQRGLPLSDFIS